MIVQANGSYKASTTRGSMSEGQFYLQDGKLRVKSQRRWIIEGATHSVSS